MVNFTILENGKLRITFIDNTDREKLGDYLRDRGSNDALRYITESYWTNGWGVTSADKLWQMSEAPIIVEDRTLEDDSSQTLHGKAWYFSNHMLESEIETLLDEGYVDFDFWCEFDNERFPPT